MKKAYIHFTNREYNSLFKSMGFELTESFKEADLVCFTGGEDVSAALYGDKQHENTYNSPTRDREESELFQECQKAGIPMVGICRGGQFLNVMNGGRMYQHVGKHAGIPHVLADIQTAKEILVTSTHHQMMLPGEDAETVGIANLGGYREWFDGQVAKRDKSNTDFEVLYYEKSNCLCFQPHPEMYRHNEEFQPMRDYFATLIKTKLGV